jgi:hypothetical protein
MARGQVSRRCLRLNFYPLDTRPPCDDVGDDFNRKRESLLSTTISDDDDIRAKLADAQAMLEALESGNLHIGRPFEGRTEAKMYDLRRKIAEYQSILDKGGHT